MFLFLLKNYTYGYISPFVITKIIILPSKRDLESLIIFTFAMQVKVFRHKYTHAHYSNRVINGDTETSNFET